MKVDAYYLKAVLRLLITHVLGSRTVTGCEVKKVWPRNLLLLEEKKLFP